MDIGSYDSRPNCDDIARATILYNAGGSTDDLRNAFPSMTDEQLCLLWCAATTSFVVNDKMFGDS